MPLTNRRNTLPQSISRGLFWDACGRHRDVLPKDFRKRLKSAELVELFGGDAICYASHFAVAPEARGRTVASLLIAALYRFYLNEGVQVGISYCALNFVSFYYQLGYRPYAENFRMDAGIRVPIVHCIRDWHYLKEVGSPLARLCSITHDDQGAAARRFIDLEFSSTRLFLNKSISPLGSPCPNHTERQNNKKMMLFRGLFR